MKLKWSLTHSGEPNVTAKYWNAHVQQFNASVTLHNFCSLMRSLMTKHSRGLSDGATVVTGGRGVTGSNPLLCLYQSLCPWEKHFTQFSCRWFVRGLDGRSPWQPRLCQSPQVFHELDVAYYHQCMKLYMNGWMNVGLNGLESCKDLINHNVGSGHLPFYHLEFPNTFYGWFN